jgi:hypothetical protein
MTNIEESSKEGYSSKGVLFSDDDDDALSNEDWEHQ